MAFNDDEISVEQSRPVEAYTILVNGTAEFYWTSQEQEFQIGSQIYDPISLERGRYATGPQTREDVFEIRVPYDNEFVQRYTGIVPADRVEVHVDRVQRVTGPTEVVRIFEGQVQSVGFEANATVGVIAVQPLIGSASRQIPRATFSSGCNHILYSVLGCRVSRTGTSPLGFDFQLADTQISAVTGANSSVLTVPGAAAFPDDWFTGGDISINNDDRLIINHTGNQIRLLVGFPFSVALQNATLQAGCAHDPTACTDKFNNYINYDGWSFVPGRNIFTQGIQ